MSMFSAQQDFDTFSFSPLAEIVRQAAAQRKEAGGDKIPAIVMDGRFFNLINLIRACDYSELRILQIGDSTFMQTTVYLGETRRALSKYFSESKSESRYVRSRQELDRFPGFLEAAADFGYTPNGSLYVREFEKNNVQSALIQIASLGEPHATLFPDVEQQCHALYGYIPLV